MVGGACLRLLAGVKKEIGRCVIRRFRFQLGRMYADSIVSAYIF